MANIDIDSINPDALQKPDLIDVLVTLTGGSSAQWQDESIRSLRAEVATAIHAARETKARLAERDAVDHPQFAPTAALDALAIEQVTEAAAALAEGRVLQRLRLVGSESSEDEGVVEVAPAALKRLSLDHEQVSLSVPEVDPTYALPFGSYAERLERKSRSTLKPRNVALTGPTGAGKTTFAIQFAARNNRPLYILNFGEVTEAEQLLGQWEARDGSTFWRDSQLVQAIQTPFALVLLDELNRGATAKVTNAAFEMLDDRRSLGGHPVAPGVIFFATLNEGVDYTGTDELDAAIADRFSERLYIGYSNKEVDILQARYGCDAKLAENAVRLATNLRGNYPLSLRVLGAFIEEVKFGAPVTEALLCTFAGRVPVQTLVTACSAAWPDIDFSGYLNS